MAPLELTILDEIDQNGTVFILASYFGGAQIQGSDILAISGLLRGAAVLVAQFQQSRHPHPISRQDSLIF